jgi:hypothetical protein
VSMLLLYHVRQKHFGCLKTIEKTSLSL